MNTGNRIGQWSESINSPRMLIWPRVGLVFGGPELFIFAQFCECHPVSLLSVGLLTKLCYLDFCLSSTTLQASSIQTLRCTNKDFRFIHIRWLILVSGLVVVAFVLELLCENT